MANQSQGRTKCSRAKCVTILNLYELRCLFSRHRSNIRNTPVPHLFGTKKILYLQKKVLWLCSGGTSCIAPFDNSGDISSRSVMQGTSCTLFLITVILLHIFIYNSASGNMPGCTGGNVIEFLGHMRALVGTGSI